MRSNRQVDTEVLLDFYEGAYGPTVRIDVQAPLQLLWIREVLVELGAHAPSTVRINEKAWIRCRPTINSLTLVAERSDDLRPRNVKLNSTMPFDVTWRGSTAYWERCIGLIDGLLLDVSKSGHQYLTDISTDKILIELAFLEK